MLALNRQQEDAITRIENHNSELRARAAVIPPETRGPFTVEEFCALRERADIDDTIQATERLLEAAGEQDTIR